MFEGYRGKIVHFIGGINEYIGEIDEQSSLDEGWIRIKNPVHVRLVTRNNETGLVMERLGGPGEAYLRYVDLWVPGRLPVEIRVLDEEGHLYSVYVKQRDMPKIEKIVLPGAPEIQKMKHKLHQ